ncbi:hypothetical protein [Burkholderia cepacia]|uniref:hypothetical protein n=1 Tax=Burkholderia cepacia TaxID=292 RepID=UPI0015892366|nr:hypothetical protein [Burkholderia cepacia]
MKLSRKQSIWALMGASAMAVALYAVYVHRTRLPSAPVTPHLDVSRLMSNRPAETPHQDSAGIAPLELGNTAQPALRAGSNAAATSAAAMQVNADTQRRQAALQAAMQRMQALLHDDHHDGAAFSQAIAEVEQANGSPIMSGVNLEALRHNIEIASQMQQLTQQMQVAQNVASQPDAQFQATLKEQGAHLQELAKQLSTNIMYAPATGTPVQGQ